MDRIEGGRRRLQTLLLIVVGVVFIAVTLFRVPLATVFTLGLLLICPLLMVGMHGGGRGIEDATSHDEVGPDPNTRRNSGDSS